jgi:hypothetical protein
MYHNHSKLAATTPIGNFDEREAQERHHNTAQLPMLPTPHNHPCCQHHTTTHVANTAQSLMFPSRPSFRCHVFPSVRVAVVVL